MNRQEINSRIDAQLPVSKAGLTWLKTPGFVTSKEAMNIAYEKIINNRRLLKRIRYANNINPAAAIYGESQVGKSYLVDCILSSEKIGTLKVYDGEKKPYDFIYELNPIGEGKESTSLVSRFTTKQVWENSKFPIKVTLLSPIDIALTLCDSFYNDIKTQNELKAEQLIQRAENLRRHYESAKKSHNYIEEDDIYDIKEYFDTSKGYLDKVGAFGQELLDSNYLTVLSEIIGNIPVSDWANAFSILWNDNKIITEVFEKLIREYSRMDFQHEVFISMDAVLRKNGTLLAVDRIYELFELTTIEGKETIQVKKAEIPDMLVSFGGKEVTVKKSAFCALAAELTFQIDDRLAEEKEFLNYIDLLDFPGARSRERYDEQNISTQNCCAMLLRGKVAYLFNKFTAQYLISNLLFCHHDTKSEVKTLSDLLKNWIKDSIGETSEERQRFIDDSVISPLFLICTKFNIDMKRSGNYDNAKEDEKQQVLNEKWFKRFETTLKSVIAETPMNWFSKWTKSESFKNMYLLRSFEYSSQRELNIFTGYLKKDEAGGWTLNKNDDDSLVGETGFCDGYEQYLSKLKTSFVNSDFVKEHFIDPPKSWDAVATPKYDGSKLIIENLTIAAKNTYHSRQRKFERQLKELFAEVDSTLRSFYHDDTNADKLVDAIKKAGRVQFELDSAFGRDSYFFGRMIQRFQYNEGMIYNFYLEKISKIEMIEQADISRYIAVRLANPGLQHSTDKDRHDEIFAYNLEILKKTYAEPDEEKLKTDFTKKGIDLEELFFGEENRIKSNSVILAEGLVEKWKSEALGWDCEKWKLAKKENNNLKEEDKYLPEYHTLDHLNDFIQDGFDDEALMGLMTYMHKSFDKLEIVKLIAKRIRQYVDRYNQIEEIMEMIADISSEIISSFVSNIGFTYMSDDKLNELREANANSGLDLVFEHDYLNFGTMETEDLTELFETLKHLEELLNQRPLDANALRHVPNFAQYTRWKDLMKISFVSVCNIPTYNEAANSALGEIIKQQTAIAAQ